MTDKQPSPDFEQSWQSKLSAGLDLHLDSSERDSILAGGELLDQTSPTAEKLAWTYEMFCRLEGAVDEKTRQQILTGCGCQYPKAELDDARGIYLETGDVDQVIDLLQAKFEDFLREGLELDEDLVLEIIARGWGLAGVRKGRRIISTKIPKSGYLVEYFKTEDPLEKRKLYCHCPRLRDSVGEQPQLPGTYCYCGAGFYQGIWETVLREPVQVEVLESVMQGGDVCKIAVLLPDSVSLEQPRR